MELARFGGVNVEDLATLEWCRVSQAWGVSGVGLARLGGVSVVELARLVDIVY